MGCPSSKPLKGLDRYASKGNDEGGVVATPGELAMAGGHTTNTFSHTHVGQVTSIVDAGGNRFITGGDEDQNICMTDWQTGQVVKTWSGHQRAINRLAYGKKSGIVISCSRDLSIRKWGEDSTEQHAIMEGHTLNVSAVALSSDEKVLLSGARDTSMRLWDVDTAAQTSMCKISRNLVTCIRAVPGEENGAIYVQGSEDLRLRTWDTRLGLSVPAQTIDGYVYFPLCADVSADGNYYLTSSKGFNGVGCEGRIYDRRKAGGGEGAGLLHTLSGHQQDSTSCAFLPPVEGYTNPLAATASKDCTVRVWDTVSGECVCDHLQSECGMFTGMAAASQQDAADLYACSFAGSMYVYKCIPDAHGQVQLACLATGGEAVEGDAENAI